jgi:hypothetical protein
MRPPLRPIPRTAASVSAVSARLVQRHADHLDLHDGIAVAELGCGLGVGRDAREGLDDVRARQPGVEGRAAAEDLHAPDRQQLARAQLETAEMRGAELRIESALQRPRARLGLLVDLLQHEVRKRSPVVRFVTPRHLRRALLGRPVVERHGAVAVGLDGGELPVIEVDDLTRVAHERRGVRGDEHLALPDADHHGAAVARHHESIGMACIHDGEAVGPVDRGDGGSHRLGEVAARGLDEMRQQLGVGVRAEDVRPSASSRGAAWRRSRWILLWATAMFPVQSTCGCACAPRAGSP